MAVLRKFFVLFWGGMAQKKEDIEVSINSTIGDKRWLAVGML